MNSTALSIKQHIAEQTAHIVEVHKAGAEGFAVASALTGMMDDAIRMAYGSLPSHANHIAMLAIGGYGRAELCPKSDVDMMILAEDGKAKEEAEEIAKSLLLILWDAGINVGHSVRTVKEAMAQHTSSIDAWAAMLESRFICGNEQLAQKFSDAIRRQVAKKNDRWFVEGVFDEVVSRHERFGNSVKLLEPNIKKSAGGLRDFQSLFWMFRGTDPDFLIPIDPRMPASITFLDLLMERKILDAVELSSVMAALQFFFRTRHEMHIRRAASHDSLEYVLQREVADALGFNTKAELLPEEVFMRKYYLHARTIHRLFQNISPRFREMIESVHYTAFGAEKLTDTFVRMKDTVTVSPEITRLSEARQVMEAFALAAEHDLDLHMHLARVITNSVDTLAEDGRTGPEVAAQFRRVLRSRRVAQTLYSMNELNVLGTYLPEWGNLVAFFQHNMYHYFTADEHTLIAVGKAERLREQQSFMREVFRNLRRKDVLFLAILLHDIGKPRGVADHETTGVEIAKSVLSRIGMMDVFDDVAFLIRNHLVMEQVAFRRNIHDPATIKEFAARFQTAEQLDYLYLLTYADLSAVNINVWTEWKSSLLQELYQLTAEVLRRNLKGAEIDEFKQARHAEAIDSVVDRLSESLPRDHIHKHLNGIQNEAYVALFSDEEIGQHIHKSSSDEPVSTIFTTQEGYTEITVIADDAPFALSKFCAVLAANDANIFDANIFTREDGIIIDRFRVSDAATKTALPQKACNKIAGDLTQVMLGKLDIEHLFEAHRRKWKRRQRIPANPNIRTDVQFEEHPQFTIIDVYAPDALGFLYRVTETISKFGLDIYFAKIATRVDGIVDAFYVLDRNGNRLTDPERQDEVRREILATVAQISDQELSATAS